MRIAVTSQLRPGSHRAHAINVIKTAGGFARLGHDVRLFCLPPIDGLSLDAALRGYAEPDLTTICGPESLLGIAGATDQDPAHRIGQWIAEAVLAWQPDVCYARDFWSPLMVAQHGIPTIVETHAYKGDTNPLLARVLRSTRENTGISAVSTISPVLKAYYESVGADPAKVHVTPDGVDTELFTPPPEPNTPMRQRPRVTYAGHLYDYKGIPTVLEAAALLPEIDVRLVGGTAKDIARVRTSVDRAGLGNVQVVGRVSHADVPPHLWDADALLLPPSANEPSKDWTSPVKLGEYLAAARPIVASSIPSLHDWIDDRVCTWFEPDNPEDLARAIREALDETPEEAAIRASAAATLAETFSYPRRAASMLSALDAATRAAA